MKISLTYVDERKPFSHSCHPTTTIATYRLRIMSISIWVPVPNRELNKGMDRFRYFYFEGAHRSTGIKSVLLRVAYYAAKALPVRRPQSALKGLRLYAGSSWWTLSGPAVRYIEQTISKDRRIVEFFRYAKMPDESFFQTILGNSDFLPQCYRADVYTDWSDPKDAPCYIREDHLVTILNNEFQLADGLWRRPCLLCQKIREPKRVRGREGPGRNYKVSAFKSLEERDGFSQREEHLCPIKASQGGHVSDDVEENASSIHGCNRIDDKPRAGYTRHQRS